MKDQQQEQPPQKRARTTTTSTSSVVEQGKLRKAEEEEARKQQHKEIEDNNEEEDPDLADDHHDNNDNNNHNNNDLVIRDGFPSLYLPIDKEKVQDDDDQNYDGKKNAKKKNVKNMKKEPWIDGDEPIPRHDFWAFDNSIQFNNKDDEKNNNNNKNSNNLLLHQLRKDCQIVFTARSRCNPDDDEDDNDQDQREKSPPPSPPAYSEGITYFCPCQMKPRCALEGLVLDIFHKHTQDIANQGIFDPEQSGAEWWTLILNDDDVDNKQDDDHDDKYKINSGSNKDGEEEEKKDQDDDNDNENDNVDDADDDDEVGFHFDADYGLEERAPNILLHPRLATVTYLSNHGVPTVVLDKRPPSSPNDIHKKSLNGDICKAWLSHPRIGRHIAFDGRLLHGAPASIFPSAAAATTMHNNHNKSNNNNDDDYPADVDRRRITLLVNIWLNNCPLDAEILDDDIVEQLSSLSVVDDNKNDDNDNSNKKDDSKKPAVTMKTTAYQSTFAWSQDLPLTEKTKNMLTWNISASSSASASSSSSNTKKNNHNNKDDNKDDEDVVLCNHLVTVSFGAPASSFRQASEAGSIVEITMDPGVISLKVGPKVEEDGDEDDQDEDDSAGGGGDDDDDDD